MLGLAQPTHSVCPSIMAARQNNFIQTDLVIEGIKTLKKQAQAKAAN